MASTEKRKAYIREYQRRWLRARRAQFFAGKKCMVCQSTIQLELHHVDRSTKVSHHVWSWRQERRDAEIAQCQVLCSRCHLEKTNSDPTLFHFAAGELNPKCKYNDDQVRLAIALFHVGVSIRDAVERARISKYTLYRIKSGARKLTPRGDEYALAATS
jgi:5-methylcytosine-specific restriction endonuclease McrA